MHYVISLIIYYPFGRSENGAHMYWIAENSEISLHFIDTSVSVHSNIIQTTLAKVNNKHWTGNKQNAKINNCLFDIHVSIVAGDPTPNTSTIVAMTE